MKFQILDADYTYLDDKPLIRLFGRDDSGKSICCKVPNFEPYFYAKAKEEDAKIIQENFKEHIKRIEVVSRYKPIGYFKAPTKMLKIILYDPKGVPIIRDELKKMVEEIYETDILFRNRFLIDKGLGGMRWVETNSQKVLNDNEIVSDIKIISEKVVPIETLKNAQLRHLAFDIECISSNNTMPEPENSQIVMISLAFSPEFENKKALVLVSKKTNLVRDDIESLGSEEKMLNRFFEIIRIYDPDILVGYNSNSFDIPYIIDRIKALNKKGINIDSKAGRDEKPIYYRKFGNTTRISITGRIAVDVLPLLRKEFSLKQYTLRNSAKELLNLEKLDIPFNEMEEYWNSDGEKLEKFIEYSKRDSELALEFILKLHLIDKHIALSKVSGTLLQDIVDGGQTNMIENLILREYMKHDRVLPPKPSGEVSDERFDENEELEGGEVFVPQKGLLENIVILDYKSLYPTIMMAHNLCYTTEILKDKPEPENIITSPLGGEFVSAKVYKGIVPSILEELLNKRQITKEKMKTASDEEKRVLDATQLALKILLNSFYGYSGYARARLYSLTLAGAVTSYGRENILSTKRIIENEIKQVILQDKSVGLSVVYGDTDSVFVALHYKDVNFDDAQKVGKEIARIVTSSLTKPMELVFESYAKRAIFIAKKRYAVLLWEKVDGKIKEKIKVKGMETVRRDWCELTTDTVKKVLELVLKEGKLDDAFEYVKQIVESIRDIDINKTPELFEKLILTRQYSKKTESYKNKQPHITVVEKLKNRGIIANVGDRIPFVILSGRDMFVERAEDPEYARKNNLSLDVEYYVTKQILPPIERILSEFGDYGEKLMIIREKKVPKGQKSLFDYT